MSMIVYAYAYRKNPRGCDIRQFTDPLTPDEYPGEPASVKAQHWADENISGKPAVRKIMRFGLHKPQDIGEISMKTKILKVKITFLEPVLGTWPSNQNVARDFIASKSPDAATIEDEVAALGADAVADKGMTVFPRNENGEPVLYDYQIKGFFKDSCGMLARVGGKTETGKKRAVNESGKLSAYKKVIDGLIFPQPRMIPIKVNGKIGDCQRPLRAQTAQGERVSLANSEEIPAGSTCEFEILLMDESLENAVLEWLDYGVLRGIGQWRNSGKGRFTFDIID